MDPESKKMLENTFALVEANNKMLQSMRRAQKLASFMHFIYWLIIIAIAIGSYYFMQPYVTKLQEFIKSSSSSIDQLKNIGNMIPKK